MDPLIEQLKTDLHVSEDEAVMILKAIVEYIENQHPVLQNLARDLFTQEIEKLKTV